MNERYGRKKNKGAILLGVMSLVTVIMIMISTYSLSCLLKIELYERMYRSSAAYYSAAAGYSYVKSRTLLYDNKWLDAMTWTDYVPTEFNVNFDSNRSVRIQTSLIGNDMRMEFEGRCNDVRRTIVVLLQVIYGMDSPFLVQWSES